MDPSQYPYGSSSNGGNAHPQGSSKQPKAATQKLYRDRESELFNELRTSIAGLTHQDPSTRHDILTQASRLLTRLHSENERLKQQMQGGVTGTQMQGNVIGMPQMQGNAMGSRTYYPQQPSDTPELDYVMGLTDNQFTYPQSGYYPHSNRRS